MQLTNLAQQADALLLGAVGGGVISAVISWFVYRLTRDQLQTMRRGQAKETADAIFREWWGPGMRALRKYFYVEFLPKHYFNANFNALPRAPTACAPLALRPPPPHAGSPLEP